MLLEIKVYGCKPEIEYKLIKNNYQCVSKLLKKHRYDVIYAVKPNLKPTVHSSPASTSTTDTSNPSRKTCQQQHTRMFVETFLFINEILSG